VSGCVMSEACLLHCVCFLGCLPIVAVVFFRPFGASSRASQKTTR
jgi:hypothetical protein